MPGSALKPLLDAQLAVGKHGKFTILLCAALSFYLEALPESGSSFPACHSWPVEKFYADYERNFYLTPLTHFQASGASC